MTCGYLARRVAHLWVVSWSGRQEGLWAEIIGYLSFEQALPELSWLDTGHVELQHVLTSFGLQQVHIDKVWHQRVHISSNSPL